MEEESPAILVEAKREGSRLIWGDECGFCSDHQIGTSYGRKGQTPVVLTTGLRFGCNMISAIDNPGLLAFKMFVGKFTAEVFIDFLKRLTKHGQQKAFLMVDNLRIHKCRKMQDWVATKSNNIRLFFLPKYSPALNQTNILIMTSSQMQSGGDAPGKRKDSKVTTRHTCAAHRTRPNL